MRMTPNEIEEAIKATQRIERRLIEARIFISSQTGVEKLQDANVNFEALANLMGRKLELLEVA